MEMTRTGALIVVPCFNEARRLDLDSFARLAQVARLLFVDDGSTDGTSDAVRELATRCGDRVRLLTLAANRGKATAVWHGLRWGIEHGHEIVGFADADLATPVHEIARLLRTLRASRAQVVTGARIRVAGSGIRRSLPRYVSSRGFAHLAAAALGCPYYDTQCGAKVLRVTSLLAEVLATPFRSNWTFDVELLGRLFAGTAQRSGLDPRDCVEVPLREWREVAGSKLGVSSMLRATLDLVRIAIDLRELRAAPSRRPSEVVALVRSSSIPAREAADDVA
jgi:glycosyltransferase involved in cell wall biosynthesis